jgi:murein DD-endopeptidase MepM/ murein hydrolase activator NlpD
VKKLFALLGVALIGGLAWMAAGPDQVRDAPVRPDVPVAMGGAVPATITSPATRKTSAPNLGGEPYDTPPPEAALEPVVPPEVIAPIATATAPPPVVVNEQPSMRDADAPRAMIIPVAGVPRSAMHDMFNDARGGRRHEAIDIMAPTGTPVIATDDGVVKKLFNSKPGGLTVYQFDPDQRFCYYYAHLDRYAPGLHEGQNLKRGEVLGYVGTTGNAPKNAPHLHFALIRLDKERRWWKGTYVNPYPLLGGR